MRNYVVPVRLHVPVNDIERVSLLIRLSFRAFEFKGKPYTFRYSGRSEMVTAISQVHYPGGTTNTAGVLQYVRDTMFTSRNGDRADSRNIILHVTDGSSNNAADTLREARAVRDAGIHILVAIVGTWVNMQEINAIASYPFQENKFQLTNFLSLDESFREKIWSTICNGELCSRFICTHSKALFIEKCSRN